MITSSSTAHDRFPIFPPPPVRPKQVHPSVFPPAPQPQGVTHRPWEDAESVHLPELPGHASDRRPHPPTSPTPPRRRPRPTWQTSPAGPQIKSGGADQLYTDRSGILPQHEKYLRRLQARKLQERLREVPPEELAKREREKGFQTYVNGAHTLGSKAAASPVIVHPPQRRRMQSPRGRASGLVGVSPRTTLLPAQSRPTWQIKQSSPQPTTSRTNSLLSASSSVALSAEEIMSRYDKLPKKLQFDLQRHLLELESTISSPPLRAVSQWIPLPPEPQSTPSKPTEERSPKVRPKSDPGARRGLCATDTRRVVSAAGERSTSDAKLYAKVVANADMAPSPGLTESRQSRKHGRESGGIVPIVAPPAPLPEPCERSKAHHDHAGDKEAYDMEGVLEQLADMEESAKQASTMVDALMRETVDTRSTHSSKPSSQRSQTRVKKELPPERDDLEDCLAELESNKSHDTSDGKSSPMGHEYHGRTLIITLECPWGHGQHFVGLTGLEVLDLFNEPVRIASHQATAEPYRDMNDIPGHTGDARTLEK